MSDNWPTREKDLYIAQLIMEQYALIHDRQSLGLFELVVNSKEKCMNFQLSAWVVTLAEHFKLTYGPCDGDLITRKILTNYIALGHTIH